MGTLNGSMFSGYYGNIISPIFFEGPCSFNYVQHKGSREEAVVPTNLLTRVPQYGSQGYILLEKKFQYYVLMFPGSTGS